MLLAMFIVWELEGSPHYTSMEEGQRIAFISDIGAQGLKPLFITGCIVTTIFLDLSFAAERWLRHTGRLAKNLGMAEKVLSGLSSTSTPPQPPTQPKLTTIPSPLRNSRHSRPNSPLHLRHRPPPQNAQRLPPPLHGRLRHLRHLHLRRIPTPRRPFPPTPHLAPVVLGKARFRRY